MSIICTCPGYWKSQEISCGLETGHPENCNCCLVSSVCTGLVKTITGSARITYHADGPDADAWEADFTPPFKKLDLMKALEAELNVPLPDPATLHTAGEFSHGLFIYLLII